MVYFFLILEWILFGNGVVELLIWAVLDLLKLEVVYLLIFVFGDYRCVLKIFIVNVIECFLKVGELKLIEL